MANEVLRGQLISVKMTLLIIPATIAIGLKLVHIRTSLIPIVWIQFGMYTRKKEKKTALG